MGFNSVFKGLKVASSFWKERSLRTAAWLSQCSASFQMANPTCIKVLRRGLLKVCLFFQEMFCLTQRITKVSGCEYWNHLYTHFRSLQATPFPTSIMVTKAAKWATISWTYNVLHWYKQYLISSLHKWGCKAFICNNQRGECTVGRGTLWNSQEHDVLCRPI